MRQLYFNNFTSEVENMVRSVIRDAYPRNWDEDFVTRTLVARLADWENPTQIYGFERPFLVSWDAYKLVGDLERAHGDLGVLVRVTSWEGECYEGAGFLEAKRRYPDKVTFDALKHDQLERIQSKTPHSFVLLYDYTNITGFSDNFVPWKRSEHYDSHTTFYSHAVVVPTNTVTAVKKRCTSLYKFSLPFAFQLCGRYLRGFDLDSSKEVVSAIQGYSQDIGGPRYLLVVNISSMPPGRGGEGFAFQKDVKKMPFVNPKQFEPINPRRPGPDKRDGGSERGRRR